MRTWQSMLTLVGMFVAVALLGAVSGILTELGMEWYHGLNHPPGTPPDAVFGPVWLVLYAFIAVSAWLVARQPHELRGIVLWMFTIQLLITVLWNGFFFGIQSPFAGMILMILLLSIIITYTRLAYEISSTAAYLFIPYGLWVGYAAYLNLGLMVLN